LDASIIKYDKIYREGVLKVINYFTANSFAAYPDEILTLDWVLRYEQITSNMPSYLIMHKNEVVGFASLHPYNRYKTFSHTAEITYFLLPEFTGKGLGKKLLSLLEKDAREIGIVEILASISSRNEQSLRFHEKNGFRKVGEFENIGEKFEVKFNIVYMQKSI